MTLYANYPEDLREYLLEVSRGNVPGASIVHKFGRNKVVGTSFVPVCMGGYYRTPKTAQTLSNRYRFPFKWHITSTPGLY